MFGRRGQGQFRGGGMGRRQMGRNGAFNQVVQEVENLFPRREPISHIEAGRAAILAGDVATGVASLRLGLTMLASQGRFHRMQVLGQRAVDELQARGLTADANEIAAMLGGALPAEAPAEPAVKRPILPTHCPSCGGVVNPDELEWIDAFTAECDYCGTPLRGQ